MREPRAAWPIGACISAALSILASLALAPLIRASLGLPAGGIGLLDPIVVSLWVAAGGALYAGGAAFALLAVVRRESPQWLKVTAVLVSGSGMTGVIAWFAAMVAR